MVWGESNPSVNKESPICKKLGKMNKLKNIFSSKKLKISVEGLTHEGKQCIRNGKLPNVFERSR